LTLSLPYVCDVSATAGPAANAARVSELPDPSPALSADWATYAPRPTRARGAVISGRCCSTPGVPFAWSPGGRPHCQGFSR